MSKPSSASARLSYWQSRFPRVAFVANKIATSQTGRTSARAWSYRRPILVGFFATYTAVGYLKLRRDAYLRDYIHPETYLVWKVYDGSIVESRGPPSVSALINAPAAGEEPPRTMEMFEVIRALKWAQRDERIQGIFADFSGLHLPSSVTPSRLGLAQIEELTSTINEFKAAKREQFGDKTKPSIAWTDSFDNQGSFLLASAFDEVWLQPSGSVPLTGLGAQIPFFKKVLDFFGIKILTEARREYKSMVSTFNREESLPPAQVQNEAELLGELNRGLLHAIAVNRFPTQDPDEMADKIQEWTKQAPFSAREAKQLGLITGTAFKRELVKRLVEPEHGGNDDTKFKSLYHYNKVNDRLLDRQLNDDQKIEVGVVYLLGTISNAPGEFSTSSVLKGLKEAAESEDVQSIVLRIDSGGGDVVASESIWDAVRRVREDYGKPVVASFGNAAASGGYYAASAANAILACESTITGSIGVASIRPTVTRAFFDRFNVGIQSFFTGSTALSSLHEPDDAQRAKASQHVDEMYDDFLQKVCDGRDISRDVIEELAGGRVMTGLSAWIKTNPDAEVFSMQAESAEDVIDQGLAEAAKVVGADAKLGAAASLTTKKIKAVSLTSQWTTRDVAVSSGNNTVMIDRLGSAKSPKPSTDDYDQEQGILSELITKAEEALKAGANAIKGELDSTAGDKSKSVGTTVDEETELAMAAHSAAEASRTQRAPAEVDGEIQTPGVAEETEELGPYGRGLVDAVGGIYDSAFYAMTLALQTELDELVTKHNLTQEQAAARIRPGCEREVAEDGTMSLAADLRLVRFPEDKPFWKKVQELNAKGDEPQMSLLPRSVSSTVALMLEEAGNKAAKAAVRMMIATAADPAGIASAFDDPQLMEKLRHNTGSGFGSSTRGSARAEYPLASYFT